MKAEKEWNGLLLMSLAHTERSAMEQRVRGIFARRRSPRWCLCLLAAIFALLAVGCFTTACQPGKLPMAAPVAQLERVAAPSPPALPTPAVTAAPVAVAVTPLETGAELSLGEKIAKAAKDRMGAPFAFGTEGPDTYDASGLIYACLNEAGIAARRLNSARYSQEEDWEQLSSLDLVEPGDLLFFSSDVKDKVVHVGVYVGDDAMIHASSSNNKVVQTLIDQGYFNRNFVHARRCG